MTSVAHYTNDDVLQHMLSNQEHAQQYHRRRFGELTPIAFASIPEVSPPAPFFVPRTRTVW
jgi:hypothetical protein